MKIMALLKVWTRINRWLYEDEKLFTDVSLPDCNDFKVMTHGQGYKNRMHYYNSHTTFTKCTPPYRRAYWQYLQRYLSTNNYSKYYTSVIINVNTFVQVRFDIGYPKKR